MGIERGLNVSQQSEKRITAIILLPKYYNPDERGQCKKVEGNKFKLTCKEITEMMIQRWGEGGCILDPEPKKGFWGRLGVIYEDNMMALEIDNIPDTEKDRQWLIEYAREVLCDRFCQEAILVKFVPLVEVHIVKARR